MKKQISRSLSIFLAVLFAILLVLSYVMQRSETEFNQRSSALATLSGIQDILVVNEADLSNLTASLQDEYIIKAQMAAYINQNMEQSSVEDYMELVTLLGVDELHIFNQSGEIYTGSEPKYWGYSFDSGDQMSFFLPLLSDTSLTLCQDITPNTAEEKPMMYIATWEEDGTDIVQIGIEPERIIEAQRKNELSYIFSSMPTDSYTTLLAVDATTGEVLGASDEGYTGLVSDDLGLPVASIDATGDHFYATVGGVSRFCVFTTYEDAYIGVLVDTQDINSTIFEVMLFFSTCFLVATLFCYFVLLKMIDSWIIKDIDFLISQMEQITSGNLDTHVAVGTSPEFKKLCQHINDMVSSLLNTTAKMSHVLDYVDTNIAVYEYKRDMNRVFATRKLGQLLDISTEELQILTSHKVLFEGKIKALKTHTTDQEHIYSSDGKKFLKIETLEINQDEYGVVVDMSDTVHEKMRLEYERDFDHLTDLYNRRAFFREMNDLFAHSTHLKEAVIIALDLDNLKTINDTYGHGGGDAAIQTMAQVLGQVPTPNKILARMGGDEFMLVLYGEENRHTLMSYISSLEAQLQHTFIQTDGHTLPVHMSAGYVFCSEYPLDYNELLKLADCALYIAKNHGKNTFFHYKPDEV